MFSTDKIGFGTYQWQIEGNVDNMDKAAVLGLFPYGPAANIGGDGENENDIEISKWNNGCGCNPDFTLYSSTRNGSPGQKARPFPLAPNFGNPVTGPFRFKVHSYC